MIIRKSALLDISEIKVLMDTVFGPYSRNEELFTKWISDDRYSVLVAVADKKIVGVCTWCLQIDGDYSKYNLFGEEVINYVKNKKSVCVLNLVVAPSFRKLGVGKKLSLAQIDWLKNTNCDVVVGTSWVSGSDDNSRHLFLKAGFLNLGESSDFLRNQTQSGYICSVCKTSDCSCKSIFFGIEAKNLIHFIENHSNI